VKLAVRAFLDALGAINVVERSSWLPECTGEVLVLRLDDISPSALRAFRRGVLEATGARYVIMLPRNGELSVESRREAAAKLLEGLD
jgi:hypothetical protein